MDPCLNSTFVLHCWATAGKLLRAAGLSVRREKSPVGSVNRLDVFAQVDLEEGSGSCQTEGDFHGWQGAEGEAQQQQDSEELFSALLREASKDPYSVLEGHDTEQEKKEEELEVEVVKEVKNKAKKRQVQIVQFMLGDVWDLFSSFGCLFQWEEASRRRGRGRSLDARQGEGCQEEEGEGDQGEEGNDH